MGNIYRAFPLYEFVFQMQRVHQIFKLNIWQFFHINLPSIYTHESLILDVVHITYIRQEYARQCCF